MKDCLRLLSLTRSEVPAYAFALCMLISGTVCYLLLPPQLGAFLSSLQATASSTGGGTSFRSLTLAIVLLSGTAIAGLLQSVTLSLTSERIVNLLRTRFFLDVVGGRLDVSRAKPLGELASEFSSDLAIIQDGLSSKLLDFFRHFFFSLGGVAALLWLDVRMTTFTVVGIAVIAVVLLLMVRLTTASVLVVQKQRASLVALLVECASNAYVIQAYGRLSFMNERFNAELTSTYQKVRRYTLLTSLMNPVSLVVFSVVMVSSVLFGVHEIRSGHLSVAHLITYFTYALMLIASISQVGVLGGQLRQTAAIAMKHERLLTAATPATLCLAEVSQAHEYEPAGFELRSITFGYRGAHSDVLHDVSLNIPAGKITALIGESGAGKSSIAGLLLGLFRPSSGQVTISLADGSTLAHTTSRREIAVVPQEPFLFAGTFSENIVFGRPWIAPSSAQLAASLARIHDHIMRSPGGYDGLVEEGGRNLSRGQKQRIAIARALAGQPSVLVLDEATSSLDVVSERAIKATIRELRGSVTIIVIAHQGEMLSEADHLVVLDRGRVTYQGPPPSREKQSGDSATITFPKAISA